MSSRKSQIHVFCLGLNVLIATETSTKYFFEVISVPYDGLTPLCIFYIDRQH